VNLKIVSLLPVILLCVSGCGGKKPEAKATSKPPEKAEIPPIVNLESGAADTFSSKLPREKLWTIRWKQAQVRPDSESTGTGSFEIVSGEILEAEAVSNRYEALQGKVDTARRTVELVGKVKLTSTKVDAVLTCDRVTYRESDKIVKATGNIRVTSPQGELQMDGPLWATPGLEKVGSPEVFRKL